jgi:uncharacterized protein with ParB-like and HNH nuclease domain
VEAHPRVLKSVFRSDVRLTVPLFQRPYVWGAAEQWQPLWEDVLDTMDRVEHDGSVPHFLGAIVLEQKRGSLGSLEVREVVDGQQRLTTLQILTAAISDAFIAHDLDGRLFKRLVRLLRTTRNWSTGRTRFTSCGRRTETAIPIEP